MLHGGAESNHLIAHSLIDARKATGFNLESFIIGMSNVIASDHEDNAIFFQAFGKLINHYSDLYLVVTGSEKQYIDYIINKFSLHGHIFSTGWISFDQYNKYLSSCDIFVLPFRDTNINSGRWPNKIGDYFCLKRPVLTNPTGDVEKFVNKHQVGILCDPTPEGFYEAIGTLLNKTINPVNYSIDSLNVAGNVLSFDCRIDNILELFIKLSEKNDVC